MYYDEFFKNLRLSDVLAFLQIAGPQYNGPLAEAYFQKHPLARPSSLPMPGPQYANNSVGNRGIVLDSRDRGEERLYREPSPEETNRQLEQFHRGTPAEQGTIQDIGAINESFRRAFARYFTG
jgi:hypothetical protein